MKKEQGIYSKYRYLRYIVILGATAALLPIWGHILNYQLPHVHDPILIRYIISLMMLSLIVIEYKNNFTPSQKFNTNFFILTQSVNLFVFWVTGNSQNHEYYVFGNFLAMSFIGMSYDNIKAVVAHCLCSITFFLLFDLQVVTPITPLILHAILMFSAFFLMAINSYDKFKLETKLNSQYDVNESQAKELKIAQAKNVEVAKLKSFEVMASGIAHEINNPLMIISGNTHSLMRKTNDEKIKQSLEKILSTTLRISIIIQNLKIISDDTTGFSVKSSKFNEILELTMLMVKSKLEKSNIQLNIEDLIDETLFYCCPKSISKIMTNLLLNSYAAVQHTENPQIWVKAQVIDGHIEILVSDNGKEIEESIKAHIMDPFVTHKDTGGGAGLGLSVSKSLAKEHDGELYLSDSKIKTFVLRFPLVQLGIAKKAA